MRKRNKTKKDGYEERKQKKVNPTSRIIVPSQHKTKTNRNKSVSRHYSSAVTGMTAIDKTFC